MRLRHLIFLVLSAGLITALGGTTTASSAEPISLVLLYDNSGSGRYVLYGEPEIQTKVAVRTPRDKVVSAIAKSIPPNVKIRIASFGQRVLISPNWVETEEGLRGAFSSVTQDPGPSPVWDGLYEVSALLETVAGSRVVVLVTDGMASANVHGFEESKARIVQAKVIVHVAAWKRADSNDVRDDPKGDPSTRLRLLAQGTGGTFAVVPLVDLPAYFTEMMRKLSVQTWEQPDNVSGFKEYR